MEGLIFSFPLYPAGSTPWLLRLTLETGPIFLMEEEEREPQTLVPHIKKCLLLLFQCHCEGGTMGSGHGGSEHNGRRALWAAGTADRGHRGSGHRGR